MKKMMIALIAAVALTTGGCSSDDGAAADDPTPSASSSSAAPAESEDCVAEVNDWLAIYDALAEASTLEDPSKDATAKVVDDSDELVRAMKVDCTVDLADAAVSAHNQMLRADATVTACEFVEMCGDRVDDELDKTMKIVDRVRMIAGL